jgi:hypothetical protein
MGKKRTRKEMNESIIVDPIDDNPKKRISSLAMTLNSWDDLEVEDNNFIGSFSNLDRTTIADLNPGHRITLRKGEILFIES